MCIYTCVYMHACYVWQRHITALACMYTCVPAGASFCMTLERKAVRDPTKSVKSIVTAFKS